MAFAPRILLKIILNSTPAKLLKATLDSWLEDKALRLSAAVAYYSIFSIAPLLILSISVAGFVFGEDAVRGHLNKELVSYVGAPAAEAVQSMVKSAAQSERGFLAAILGFVALFVGATGVFGQLKDALNTIWEVRVKPGKVWLKLLRERVISFGMVLVIGFLLLTSLLLTTLLAAFNDYLARMVPLPAFLWTAFAMVVSFGLETVLFALIFKILPDAKIKWRSVWIGALFTAGLFEAGKWGLSLYLGRESTLSSYGAAGAVVLLLLWVYYNACILFFGAEFTQVYALHKGQKIQPAPGAELVPVEQRLQEGLEVVSRRQKAKEEPLK